MKVQFTHAGNLFLKEWGRSANLHSLAMKWHVPTTKEKAFVKRLLERFLLPELDGLKQHSEGVAKLERYLKHLDTFEILIIISTL